MWRQEGNVVYILHQVGWQKGEPVMANRFTINVQVHKQEDKAEAEKIAKKLADFLNLGREEKREKVSKAISENQSAMEIAEHQGPLASDTD